MLVKLSLISVSHFLGVVNTAHAQFQFTNFWRGRAGKSRATTFLFFVVLCCVNRQDDGRRAGGDAPRNRLQEGAANYGPKK